MAKASSRKRRGRGEGGISQRPDGLWMANVSFGYGGTGKRQRKYVYAKTKQEIQDKLRMLSAQAPSAEPSALTVGEFLQRWLENHAKSKVAATTFIGYERITRVHLVPALGSVKLNKLQPLHIENAYAELERKGATAYTRKAAGVVLTIALNHAVRLRLIAHNPACSVAKARPEHREMKFLTGEQSQRFLEAAKGNRLYALFAVALATGLRQGELLALRWPDIDFDKGTVNVQRSLAQASGAFVVKETKSKTSRRVISLPRFAIEALRRHRAAMLAEGNISAPVFCNREGDYVNKSNLVQRDFKTIIAAANAAAETDAEAKGIEPALLPEIRFHDLRHSHATILLSQGGNIKALSARLGHSKVEITLGVYAHVLPTDDAKLAEGLNAVFG